MAEENAAAEVLDVNDASLDKYKVAADIANTTLKALLKSTVAGKTTTELSLLGNKLIQTQCDAVFKDKKNAEGKPMRKGIAFPVCYSVNDCVGNNSPMKSDAGQTLAAGDVVKIDFGVHMDYYFAVAAHTIVVGATPEEKCKGKAADVALAALHGAVIASKIIQVGATNQQVTDAMKQVAECYGVNAVQGVLMHQMKHGVIDGNNCILLREEQDQSVDEFEFEAGRVYTVDVIMSTGLGKPIERDARTTVYKRDLAKKYQLKMQASRTLLTEVDQVHAPFPFALSQASDEKQARLGLKECVDHSLLTKFPILFEKPGDLVAQFKYTVLIMPSGVVNVTTGLPLEVAQAIFESDKKLTPELTEILNRVPEKKKKKKKKEGAESDAAAKDGN